MLTWVQFRENRPVLTEWSVWNSTKRDGPDDMIVDGTTVQKVPSNGELSLAPSYTDKLSLIQLVGERGSATSNVSSLNVKDTICNTALLLTRT